MKKYREIIGGSVFFLFSAVYYAMSLQIKQFGAGQPGIITSDFLPKIYGIAVMILSAIQVLQGAVQLKAEQRAAAGGAEGKERRVPVEPEILLTFLLLLVYVGFLKSVGFLIMSVLFILGLTFLLLPRDQRGWKKFVKVLVIAVGFTVAIYLIFVQGFHLTLPVGILG